MDNVVDLIKDRGLEINLHEGEHVTDIVIIYSTEKLGDGQESLRYSQTPETSWFTALGMITYAKAGWSQVEDGDE